MPVAEKPILALGKWKTNAQMIAEAVMPMGYLPSPCLDMTFQTGKFWRRAKPYGLFTNDMDETMPSMFHEDCRAMHFRDQWFASIVIDLPYKLSGTARSPEMDAAYGTGGAYRPRDEIVQLHFDACSEAARLATDYINVKTQDQVSSGQVRWLTDDVTAHMAALGWWKVTAFVFTGARTQPTQNQDGSKRRQVHPRNNYSTWLVFAPDLRKAR